MLWYIHSLLSAQGKHVSEMSFMIYFVFYVKKRVTFSEFFKQYFLNNIKQNLGPE